MYDLAWFRANFDRIAERLQTRSNPPNLDAYRAAFLAAAAFCLAGVPFALFVSDADAAATIPARRARQMAK